MPRFLVVLTVIASPVDHDCLGELARRARVSRRAANALARSPALGAGYWPVWSLLFLLCAPECCECFFLPWCCPECVPFFGWCCGVEFVAAAATFAAKND